VLSGRAKLSAVRVVLGWVMVLLAAIGIGVGVEAALGVGQPIATSGTVTGVFTPTGWTGYAPLRGGPWVIDFHAAGGGSSPQPTLTVRVSSTGHFVAHLKPGQYVLTGFPCGSDTVDVRSGTAQNLSVNCNKTVLVPTPG